MDEQLATGFYSYVKKDGGRVVSTTASKIHLVHLDESPWCGAKVKGELVIVSHRVRSDYAECARCVAKAKELESAEGIER